MLKTTLLRRMAITITRFMCLFCWIETKLVDFPVLGPSSRQELLMTTRRASTHTERMRPGNQGQSVGIVTETVSGEARIFTDLNYIQI